MELPAAPPVSPVPLGWPLPVGLTDFFGPRGGRFRAGIDIAAYQGTSVSAAKKGRVVFTGWFGDFGNLIVVRHRQGTRTLYGHLSEILVQPGQKIARGETLGLVGSTGPHLHFEVRVRGASVDPLAALP